MVGAVIEMAFRIEFAAPFRVSTGAGADGVDVTVDPRDPLPSTSLKGVMRATAGQLFGRHAPLVGEVFGTPATESPWAWSRAVPVLGDWSRPRPASRVKLNSDHSAEHDMLVIAEQVDAAAAVFTVTQRTPLPPEALAQHRALLAVSAQATRSLGGNRRRGLGWVHISSPDGAPTRADIELLLAQANR